MLRPNGYASSLSNEPGLRFEADTIMCGHCNGHQIIKPRQDPSELGEFCRVCMKHVCKRCCPVVECRFFMRQIERSEELDYRRRQNARMLGL